MRYTRTDNADETILAIDGTLDAVTAPELRGVMDELVSARTKLVTLDLSSLRLIDSSGVGVIVLLFKRMRADGGDVKIVGLRDQPRAIFRLLRLDRIFLSELAAKDEHAARQDVPNTRLPGLPGSLAAARAARESTRGTQHPTKRTRPWSARASDPRSLARDRHHDRGGRSRHRTRRSEPQARVQVRNRHFFSGGHQQDGRGRCGQR